MAQASSRQMARFLPIKCLPHENALPASRCALGAKFWTPTGREKTYGKLYLYSLDCVSVANGPLRLRIEKKQFEDWD